MRQFHEEQLKYFPKVLHRNSGHLARKLLAVEETKTMGNISGIQASVMY